MKKIYFLISIGLLARSAFAQDSLNYTIIKTDSAFIRVHAGYDSVSGLHRLLFGENYRKEWSMVTKLPVLRISELHGGLVPERQGGGMQTTSLRLIDPTGKEWVLRCVEKDPIKLLPMGLRQTFARDIAVDAISAQHPFSALIVPPLADAASIPHSVPVIGVVSGDKALGKYNILFEGKVCLLEEREPTGGSESTLKTITDLYNNNDYSFDAKAFLRARCLDVLIGDWDRHNDNWRFTIKTDGRKRVYVPVPRDRDQVFYTNQGVIPWIVSRSWVEPYFQKFGSDILDIRYSLWSSTWLDRFPSARMSYSEWMKIVNEFVTLETDSVLDAGLRRMPEAVYQFRHTLLLKELKDRRRMLPAAMSRYYYFINRIVDLHFSNGNELVNINGLPNNGLSVKAASLTKKGNQKDSILNYTFDPAVTKEIRVYLGSGNDHVILNNTSSAIKLKFVDSLGLKKYDVVSTSQKVPVYDQDRKNLTLKGDSSRVVLHISKDSANTAFLPVNPINIWMPLIDVGLNRDDGFLLGIGFHYTGKAGFRTVPYSEVENLMITHSFATKAFDIKYHGEWINAIGAADLLMDANVKAPNNTTNFFGLGNETPFYKEGDYQQYYRARFNIYLLSPALRWRGGHGNSFSIGPSLQYYRFDPADNTGRFIDDSQVNNYDNFGVAGDKVHAGLTAIFTSDKRNNKLMPSSGSYFNAEIQGFAGLNNNAGGYSQFTGEYRYYQSFADTTFILADRIGGGVTFGSPAFYQSLFLGGQDNLLGYPEYRFTGRQMLYNDLELRVKVLRLVNYILPGQLGVTGFFDSGRVWIREEKSDKWHIGYGGGLYFIPAGLFVFQATAGHSGEGWYPYITLKMRF